MVVIRAKGFNKQDDILALPYLTIPRYLFIYGYVAHVRLKQKGYKHFFSRSVVLSYLATWFKPKRNILELHSDAWNKSKQYRKMFLKLSEKCDTFVCISETLKKDLISAYPLVKNKTIVLPDAAEENNAQPNFKFQGNPDAVKAFYVGSLYEGKGAEVLQPLSHLLDGNIELHIVTDVSSINKNDYSNSNCYFYDYMPQDEVKSVLKSADVCLLPNQASVKTGKHDIGKYTSPLKMFEYMAAGKPIISSDLPVLREVLNNKNAMLVSPTDEKTWKAALEEIQSNNNLALSLATQAKSDFQEKYTWDIRAKKILELIHDKQQAV